MKLESEKKRKRGEDKNVVEEIQLIQQYNTNATIP